MSKKRRKKLKKLAKVLGAGLAIAGLGRAFANRNARASTDADTVKLMTTDDAYSIPGGDESSFKETIVTDTPKINNNTFKTRGRIIDSAGNTIDSPGMTLNRRANTVTGVDGPPSVLNPYRNRVHVGRGNFMAKGGRVGVGKAKRGFGRAMKKGGKK